MSESDTEEPPAPRDVSGTQVQCPECGGEPNMQPEEALEVQERLQSNGYLHNDINLKCTECNHSWPHGIPRGRFEGFPDLECGACGYETMLVHRVNLNEVPSGDSPGEVTLHLKCPACYQFDRVLRAMDAQGVTLVGYPDLTGEIDEDTNPYGWVPDRYGMPERPETDGLTERTEDETED